MKTWRFNDYDLLIALIFFAFFKLAHLFMVHVEIQGSGWVVLISKYVFLQLFHNPYAKISNLTLPAVCTLQPKLLFNPLTPNSTDLQGFKFVCFYGQWNGFSHNCPYQQICYVSKSNLSTENWKIRQAWISRHTWIPLHRGLKKFWGCACIPPPHQCWKILYGSHINTIKNM